MHIIMHMNIIYSLWCKFAQILLQVEGLEDFQRWEFINRKKDKILKQFFLVYGVVSNLFLKLAFLG